MRPMYAPKALMGRSNVIGSNPRDAHKLQRCTGAMSPGCQLVLLAIRVPACMLDSNVTAISTPLYPAAGTIKGNA